MINFLKELSIFYYIIFPKVFGIGYNQFKYSVIKKKILNNKYKIRSNNYLDERIIELPWVINKLKKYSKKKILDIGCTLNFKYLINFFLKNNEIFFLNIYKEKNNFFSNQISYIQNDIRDSSFKDNFFDAITIISVIEHIGFDNEIYNNENKKISFKKKKNYEKAISETKRILKKNGKLYLTVPFGKKQYFKNYIQFDNNEIKKIIKIFKPKKYFIEYYKFDISEKKWKKTSSDQCKNTKARSKGNLGISSNSVALIEFQK